MTTDSRIDDGRSPKGLDIVLDPARIEDVAVHEAIAVRCSFEPAAVRVGRQGILAERLAIEIRTIGRDGRVNSLPRQGCLSPAHHLAVGPERLTGTREVGKVCVEDEIVLDDAAGSLRVDRNSPASTRRMMLAGAATWRSSARTSARRPRLAGSSDQRAARSSATIRRETVSLLASAHSGRMPMTFSGAEGQMSCLVATMRPTPRSDATMFQGAPTQKPSIAPAASASEVIGGGTTTSLTSRSGSMPPAASQ